MNYSLSPFYWVAVCLYFKSLCLSTKEQNPQHFTCLPLQVFGTWPVTYKEHLRCKLLLLPLLARQSTAVPSVRYDLASSISDRAGELRPRVLLRQNTRKVICKQKKCTHGSGEEAQNSNPNRLSFQERSALRGVGGRICDLTGRRNHRAKRQMLFEASFIKGLIPLLRKEPSSPSHLLKAPSTVLEINCERELWAGQSIKSSVTSTVSDTGKS